MSTETQAGATMAPAGSAPLLRMRGISKSFGAVQALTDVDFEVSAGEVVALAGDNGAGKSTLIKAISGVGPADTGTIVFDGSEVTIHEPSASAALGIAVVYQDLALCDNLDVVENLFLGGETANHKLLDEIAMEVRARELLDWMQIKTLRSVRSEVGSLSGGQRQSIAIARSLLGDPKMVILDEPTAALGVTQTAQVLELVRTLKQRNLAVILISHNLADVFAVADRVEILRLGRNAGSFPANPDQRQNVVSAITGAEGDIKPVSMGPTT